MNHRHRKKPTSWFYKSIANALILLLALSSCKTMASSSPDKHKLENFYTHKDCTAIERSLITFDKNNTKLSTKTPDNSGSIIGILSGVFIKDNDCREKILSLSEGFSDNTKIIIFTSLFRAELPDIAKTFAQHYFPNYRIEQLKGFGESSIKSVVLNYDDASKNDLLIGAYFATGDDIYLKNMLHNFKTQKKDKIKDVIRVAMVIEKFGFSLSPSSHQSKMWESIKNKYYSPKNPNSVVNFITMSSLFWALNSIAKNDENVAKYLKSFFVDNELEAIFLNEQTNFYNYSMALVLSIAKIKDQKINMLVNDYEDLK
jgi:hypothetical protein